MEPVEGRAIAKQGSCEDIERGGASNRILECGQELRGEGRDGFENDLSPPPFVRADENGPNPSSERRRKREAEEATESRREMRLIACE